MEKLFILCMSIQKLLLGTSEIRVICLPSIGPIGGRCLLFFLGGLF
jgi:hypothetical protein